MTLPFEFADVVVVAILVISGLLAYFRGLVREILSLATWIGAAFGAMYGFPYVNVYVRNVISVQAFADILTGVGLFLIILVVLTLLNHIISSRVRGSALGTIDKGLGFLFGFARGALLIIVVYIAASWFWTEDELSPYLEEARALPMVQQGADILRRVVPKDMQMGTQSAAESARDTTRQIIDAEQLMKKIPGGASATTEKPPSYNQNERREMQRLIETKR